MTNAQIIDRLAAVDGIMFDIDGCLVLSDGPSGQDGYVLPGAAAALEYARASGRRLCAFTNGSAQTGAEIAHHLRSMGLAVEDHEVLTPASVAAEVMLTQHPNEAILVIGGDGLKHDFRTRGITLVDLESALAAGTSDAAAVVIGWDTEFGRTKLELAAATVFRGASIYVTSDAPMFASKSRLNVGLSGFIATGLSHVTGQPYEVVGKPSMNAMDLIARNLNTPPDRVLVIGDDIELEAAMALKAGALAALVLTGTTTREQLDAATDRNRPELVVSSLTELVELLVIADRTVARVN
jgi:HAD superfamily hydrolase (TIGR01450 family)